jgi:signal peptidase I
MSSIPYSRYIRSPLLWACVFALFMLVFVEPHVVSGPSMLPTLEEGDRLLVEKLTPHVGLLGRGQLIVFRDPRDPKHPAVVKRIIGMPRETIHVEAHQITITHGDGTTEILAQGSELGRDGNGDEKTMRLGPYDYFLMGDNRGESRDSRDYGTIQPSEMLGRPILGIRASGAVFVP